MHCIRVRRAAPCAIESGTVQPGSVPQKPAAAPARAVRVAFIGEHGVVPKYSGVEWFYEQAGSELARLGHEVTGDSRTRTRSKPIPLARNCPFHRSNLLRSPRLAKRSCSRRVWQGWGHFHSSVSRCAARLGFEPCRQRWTKPADEAWLNRKPKCSVPHFALRID